MAKKKKERHYVDTAEKYPWYKFSPKPEKNTLMEVMSVNGGIRAVHDETGEVRDIAVISILPDNLTALIYDAECDPPLKVARKS